MYNSIQYFTEKVIPQIEKKREKFMENPTELGSIVVELKEILSEFECCILSEMLTDCNTALENSAERKALWQIKDRGERSLQTTQGMVHFTHTRFIQKETGETAYLLDDTMRLEPHVCLSEDVVEKILEKAAEESYRKAGKELGKTNKQKEWKICRCNTSKSKSVHSRTLYSACFCGKSMFLMFVDNLLPVDPQVKLHYLFAKK